MGFNTGSEASWGGRIGSMSIWGICRQGWAMQTGLRGYCTGLPLVRKSVESMAARREPLRASARHQASHHFVAKAAWSDEELLRRVAQWVVPKMDFTA